MKTLDSYRLLITPLSPIHLGTGESYEPTNYVIDDGVLHEFDTGAAMQALTDNDRAELLKIGNRRPNTEMIEALQRFFHERRDWLMGFAVQRIPVLRGVAGLYAKRVGQSANIEADGKKVVNRLEIDRTGYDLVTRKPLLYGSSLKGAIRTALLNAVNGGAPLKKVQDNGKRRDENNMELQYRLFQYRAGKFELDPMRLVQLADAFWTGAPELHTAQVHLAVNRKKAEVKDEHGNVRKSQAESKELYQILECVAAWRYRAFAGQLNVQSVAGVDDGGRKKLPDAMLRFDAARIAHACNHFYRPILEAENRVLLGRGYLDEEWARMIQRLLNESNERLANGKAFLLRVGRHSGAESVTLNGLRNIKIMKAKGEKPDYLDAAKTLWLAGEDKDQMQGLIPFGWLLVEPHSLDATLADWIELRTLCDSHLFEAYAFAAKIKEKQHAIDQARQTAEDNRNKEAERARKRAEQEARVAAAEVERQARLAAMSENQRRVENFVAAAKQRVEQLRGGKERLNAQFHQLAQKLAKDALEGADWTAEERIAVADAIQEWLPQVVEKIDKPHFKKIQLAMLRGPAGEQPTRAAKGSES